MSPLEFDLLKALAEHPNRPLSRERILNLNQQRDWDPFDRSVDLRVMRLRKKVEPDPEHPRYIRTDAQRGLHLRAGRRREDAMQRLARVAGCSRRSRSAALLALALSGCMREPEPALRIGTNVWIGSEPLYLARELGRLDPAVGAARRVSVGERGAARVSQPGHRRHGDQPRRAVRRSRPTASSRASMLVVDVSHGADVVVGRARHAHDARPQGQVGRGGEQRARRVRAEPRAGAQRHAGERRQRRAPRIERAAERVREGPGRRRRDVRSVSRAVAAAPARTTLFDSTQIPGEIVDLLAVRASVVEQQPKAIQALLAGWFDAHRLHRSAIRRTPRGAWASASRPRGEQFLEAQQGLHIPTREENLRMLGGATPELAVTGRRLMALMVDAKLLRGDARRSKNVLAPGPLRGLRCDEPARPGVAQVHGPADPAGLRRDPERRQPALPRAAGRARRRGGQPQAAGAGDVAPAEHARVPAAQGRPARRRSTRSPCWRTTTTSIARRADRRPQRRHRGDAPRVARARRSPRCCRSSTSRRRRARSASAAPA